MNVEKLKTQLIRKFSKSPEEALNWLEVIISDSTELFDEVVQTKSRFLKNEEENRLGKISHENYTVARNDITSSIIKLIKAISIDNLFRDKESDILKGVVDEFRSSTLEKERETKSLKMRLLTLEATIKELKAEIDRLKASAATSGKQKKQSDEANKISFPQDWSTLLYNLSSDSPELVSSYLQELEISQSSDVISLFPLTNFQELRRITFSEVDFSDFSVLANLEKLSQLTFEKCDNLFDLSFVKKLNHLKDLRLYYYPYASPKTIDIAELVSSKSIQYLTLYYADVLNFEMISEIESLKVVELDEEAFLSFSDVISEVDIKFKNLGSDM